VNINGHLCENVVLTFGITWRA